MWRVQIQEYLVAAVQDINILVRNVKEHRKAAAMRVAASFPRHFFGVFWPYMPLFRL